MKIPSHSVRQTLAAAGLLVTGTALAGPRTSANYSLSPEAWAPGAGQTTSANYGLDGSFTANAGLPAGTASYALTTGYAGQLVTPSAQPGDSFPAPFGDGLPDQWQFSFFDANSDGQLTGNEAARAAPGSDADSDGQTNAMEFLAGTSPVTSSSRLLLSLQPVSPGAATVQLILSAVQPGTRYTLESGTDPETFFTAASVTPSAPAVNFAFPPVPAAAARRFYRVRLERAP